MNINQAIIKRLEQVCIEKKSTICDICLKGGMSPSNIYDLLHQRTKHSKVNTIASFCEGAGITLGEFFSTPLFENLNEE